MNYFNFNDTKDYLVVSYFTLNTSYEMEVQNLLASLKKFNLPYYIEGIESFGSWQRNTQHKVDFITECLDRFDMPIVYLDVDAVVQREPALFDKLDCDLAVHYRQITEQYRQLLSGTIYISPTDLCKELLEEWKHWNSFYHTRYEQKNLQEAVENFKDKGLRIYELPISYVKIFDLPEEKYTEPVIEHFQASRRLKKEVDYR
jgi:hypothetical protein